MASALAPDAPAKRRLQLPAVFALYLRSVSALGLRHLSQDETSAIVADILTAVDVGEITGRSRTLASLLSAVVDRYPLILSQLEELWTRTSDANKRPIAECVVLTEAGSLGPRSLSLARRPDCPTDVANYIHAKFGG